MTPSEEKQRKQFVFFCLSDTAKRRQITGAGQLLKLKTDIKYTLNMCPVWKNLNLNFSMPFGDIFGVLSVVIPAQNQHEYQNYFTYCGSSVFTDGACGVFIDGTHLRLGLDAFIRDSSSRWVTSVKAGPWPTEREELRWCLKVIRCCIVTFK